MTPWHTSQALTQIFEDVFSADHLIVLLAKINRRALKVGVCLVSGRWHGRYSHEAEKVYLRELYEMGWHYDKLYQKSLINNTKFFIFF